MKTSEFIDPNLPVACHVNAIPAAERARWMEVGQEFYARVDAVRELPDGYAFRVGPEVSLRLAAEYVSRDRQCCAFLQWEIIATQGGGPTWLRVRGPEGTREFLRRAIEESTLLPEHVARAAGFSTANRTVVDLENVERFADKLRS